METLFLMSGCSCLTAVGFILVLYVYKKRRDKSEQLAEAETVLENAHAQAREIIRAAQAEASALRDKAEQEIKRQRQAQVQEQGADERSAALDWQERKPTQHEILTRCPSCDQEIPESKRFCGHCGQRLA